MISLKIWKQIGKCKRLLSLTDVDESNEDGDGSEDGHDDGHHNPWDEVTTLAL